MGGDTGQSGRCEMLAVGRDKSALGSRPKYLLFQHILSASLCDGVVLASK